LDGFLNPFNSTNTIFIDEKDFNCTNDLTILSSTRIKLIITSLKILHHPLSFCNMKTYICTFLFVALAVSTAFSQKEANIWYFGNKAGLDFNTSPPTAISNTNMNTSESCSSISDHYGNLLFYTDGLTIWNRSHGIMLNGQGLLGHNSSTQGALIIKQPGNCNIYYVFTTDAVSGSNGFRYSVVDMNLASGNGSVTIKNVQVITPCCEKMAAIRSCTSSDIWIIIHDTTSKFLSYRLSSAGLNMTPVISATGQYYGTLGYQGCIKFNPTGDKLAAANTIGFFELFDFDDNTGLISNPILLCQGNSFAGMYGCEFSNDGKKVYGSLISPSRKIFQWDASLSSSFSIIGSSVTIASTSVDIGALQLANDGKIYVAHPGYQYLSVVLNPNNLGASCNFSFACQSCAPKYGNGGLPQFLSSYMVPSGQFSINVITSCSSASFGISQPSSLCFQSSITGQSWNFSDFASGIANTSTLSNPAHVFSNTGLYSIFLAVQHDCYSDSARKTVTVSSCVGLENYIGESKRENIYPNPSSGKLTVFLPSSGCLLEIRDAFGTPVITGYFGEGSHEIDLTLLSDGLYYSTIYSDQGISKKSLIIKKNRP
jgi:hypothetical protein